MRRGERLVVLCLPVEAVEPAELLDVRRPRRLRLRLRLRLRFRARARVRVRLGTAKDYGQGERLEARC